MINAIRKQLRTAIHRMPQTTHGYIKTLDAQLYKFASSSESDKAALRPVIEQSCTKIERLARAGR